MMTSAKRFRTLAFFFAFFYSASTCLYAENVIGKIQSIRPLQSGQIEVVIEEAGRTQTVILNSSTLVESVILAKEVKNGANVSITQSRGGGGERKGFKSPFRGIPKNMRKSMGLPEIAETPDIPGRPKEAEVPEIPKLPKGPKLGQKGEAQAPAEGEEGNGGRRKSAPPEHELTDEEKSLYGKADANKPLLNSTEDEDDGKEHIIGKVVSVKKTEKGIKLEIEGLQGKKQELVLSPNRSVVQTLTSEILRENMSIRAETVKSKKLNIAQKITVVQ